MEASFSFATLSNSIGNSRANSAKQKLRQMYVYSPI